MHTIIAKHFLFNRSTLVKRVKYRTNGNEADAEDVVQEAYCRALKYKDSFEMGMNFGHWFSRIVANAYKDWKREQYNHSLNEEFDENEVEPTEDNSVQNNLIKRIAHEIDLVADTNHKEILRLHLVFGFKLREVVQITHLKYREVTYIITKFKEQLKVRHA